MCENEAFRLLLLVPEVVTEEEQNLQGSSPNISLICTSEDGLPAFTRSELRV